jgi:hypothetical protein
MVRSSDLDALMEKLQHPAPLSSQLWQPEWGPLTRAST